eukprot:SM000009S23625  [mRNA]  locus=s9:1139531:1144092:- [translate_table: standard]
MVGGCFPLARLLLLLVLAARSAMAMLLEDKAALREDVRQMFYHAYDNYMLHAFPHDELKPLTKSYTDSLGELGNLQLEHLSETYNGTALTLIDSLTRTYDKLTSSIAGSLAVLGNGSEFEKSIEWLSKSISFDTDVRVNVFECNIRILGGLLSAHLLAKSPGSKLLQKWYDGRLLVLAEDLGRRLLPAFQSPTGIPYAWVNLKASVLAPRIHHNTVSGKMKQQRQARQAVVKSTLGLSVDVRSFILEFGILSRLTKNDIYESVALRALRKLWGMRSSLNLVGTTLNVETGEWIEQSSGIGAGVDSFFEYLLKAHILFGEDEYWHMFQTAYSAVQQHYRSGPWYHEADMHTGQPTHLQFTSLQAFWPAVQVLMGDVSAANESHRSFFSVWEKFGIFPERYFYSHQVPHPTERYYPLRPELAESTFALYQATQDPWYLEVGRTIVNSLNVLTRVAGGFASVRDVTTMELEDHQHSFFLAETCKYLYLLFDDTFMKGGNYIFSTEGHPLPVLKAWHRQRAKSGNVTVTSRGKQSKKGSAMSHRMCPDLRPGAHTGSTAWHPRSACHVADRRRDHTCRIESDCGVDAESCRARICSPAKYCGLPASTP